MEGIERLPVLSSYVNSLVAALYLLGTVAQPETVSIFGGDLLFGVIAVGWMMTE